MPYETESSDGGTVHDRTSLREPAPGSEPVDPEVERLVDTLLPFKRDNCIGVSFDMHGARFEIVGDLGGYAVYRRRDRAKSACWLISWEDLAKDIARRDITIRI